MDPFWRSKRHITSFHARLCLYGGFADISPFMQSTPLHPQKRNFWGVSHFQAKRAKYSTFHQRYCMNSSQILHTSKNHQISLVRERKGREYLTYSRRLGPRKTYQSINQSMNQWINQWINQSINQWINEWINQSMNQSINQSINQSVYLLTAANKIKKNKSYC